MDWLKEILEKACLEEEVVNKVMEQTNDIKMIPKTRFDEINERLKESQAQLAERDEQLKGLQDNSASLEDLQAKITELTELNAKTASDYEQKITNMKYDTAINKLFENNKYADLLIGKIDRNQLSIDENGEVTGLTEQFDGIKEKYADLLQPSVQLRGTDPNLRGTNNVGMTKEQFNKMGYKERCELYNTNRELYDSLKG